MYNNKITQPVTQKWLTNVIAVQLMVNDKIFEVACYANKIRAFRSGIEKCLSEVLQTDTIFTDMVQGNIANNQLLLEAFGTTNKVSICEQILKQGKVQLTETERVAEQQRALREIVAIICQRTYCSVTGFSYPPQLIEETIKQQLHYSPNTFPVSEQAASVIKQLQNIVDLRIKLVQVQIELAQLEHEKFIKLLCNRVKLHNLKTVDNLIQFEVENELVGVIRELLKTTDCKTDLQVQKTFKLFK